MFKPHGYAGDFEIIDRICTKWVSPDPMLQKWDSFFHSQKAPNAVRNRVSYFHRMIDEIYDSTIDRPLRVLNLGVGPGRCVYQFISDNPDKEVLFDSIDHDQNAIDYAKALNYSFCSKANFIKGNLKSFRSGNKYDLVWCSGVFDYLPDGLFRALLPRLLKHVANDGQFVLGNFSENNPTRDYMECGEWFLHHRSEVKLRSLAEDSGISPGSIYIEHEPENVNLFLHIKL